jgi:hypothetical protein
LQLPFKIIGEKGMIMKSILPLMFLSFIVSGCFSSTLVTPTGEKGDLSYPQFNEKMGNDEADIDLRDGRKITAEGIYVGRDSVSWFDQDHNEKISIPTENVRNIVTVNHTSSAWLGFGIGAAVGVVVFLAETAGPHNDVNGVLEWLIAPPSGALIGAGIGGLIGWPSRYEFKKELTQGNNK